MTTAGAELLFRQAPVTTGELLFGQLEALPDQTVTLTAALPGLSGHLLVAGAGRAVTLAGALPGLSGHVLAGRVGGVAVAGTLAGLHGVITVSPPREVVVTGALPGLGGVMLLGAPVDVALLGALPGLGGVTAVRFDVAVDRPIVGQTGSAWQRTGATSAGAEDRRQPPTRLQPAATARWTPAASLRAGAEQFKPRVLAPVRMQGESRRSPTFVAVRDAARTAWQDMSRLRRALQALHQDADARRASVASGYQDRYRLRSAASASAQTASPLRREVGHQHTVALPVRLARGTRWQEAMRPPPGWGWQPPEPPTPEPCYLPDPHLLFGALAGSDGHLVFICDRHTAPGGNTVIVPVRRVYMVTNSVSLLRVSDGVPVHASALSVSLDVESWAWGFTASVPASMLGLVEPAEDGPVELLATINGMAFHLLAEQVARERSFGSAVVRLQGRGRIAELDDPYAPTLSFGSPSSARTAQQLMADVLTVNGVPMDWAVDWALDDWLVPAGAWSHQGSYITALNAIAKAAGGYLQPHASAKSLKVLHRYPAAPWAWGDVTPDLVLPASVARRESKTWQARPAYNRVFVQGQGQGLLGQVTRDGTAGDLVAPLIVDPLMTDVAAARQRGRAELGQGGRQITVGLGLPVLAATGIVLPGTFIEYADGADTVRGLVRSVSIDVGFPAVWQTIGVETHV